MNVAVYITPQPDHPEEGPTFLGAITEVDGVNGEAPLVELLPPNWNGKYTPHFYEIGDDFCTQTEVVWDMSFFTDLGITHVALLEGPKDARRKDPYWFNGEKIDENSVVCWYRKDRGDFYFFHCKRCAVMTLQWIVGKQEAWHADSQFKQQGSKARH